MADEELKKLSKYDGLTPIRKKAMDIISNANIPLIPGQINSNGSTEKEFTRLTGGKPTVDGKTFDSRHELLLFNWRQSKIAKMTACNEFVNWYSFQLLNVGLGAFPTLERLTSLHMEHAWVPTNGTSPPKPGDILRHNPAFHMDVALGFMDEIFYRVGAGQGGPKRDKDGNLIEKESFDVLKRIKGGGKYNFNNLLGWIDIDIYFASLPQTTPQTPTPQQQPTGGTTGSLWLNQHGDHVHWDAPLGGGGHGFFRLASSLTSDPHNRDLPHHWSPSARNLDPLDVLKFRKSREQG